MPQSEDRRTYQHGSPRDSMAMYYDRSMYDIQDILEVPRYGVADWGNAESCMWPRQLQKTRTDSVTVVEADRDITNATRRRGRHCLSGEWILCMAVFITTRH